MPNHLDALINQVSDPKLREDLRAEIKSVTSDRDFGLVFEKHLPELIRLHSSKIKRGSTVQHKDNYEEVWRVVDVAGETARLTRTDEDGIYIETETLTENLIVVSQFGQPVYLGLEFLDRVYGSEVDTTKPSHVLINGENYHVLEMLLFAAPESVDVLFIDPPYNTGSSGWQYNDRYVDNSDSYKHSLWLSFMERRIKLAKHVLKPTGVIFISIDDNEQARLKLLCDQIFGEDNFVDTLMVEMSATQGMKVKAAQQGTIVKNGEFIHIYRASPDFDDVPKTPLFDGVEGYDHHYNLWVDPTTLEITPLGQRLLSDEKFMELATPLIGKNNTTLPAKTLDRLLKVSPEIRDLLYGEYAENIHRQMMASLSIPESVRANLMSTTATNYDSGERTYLLVKNNSGNLEQLNPLSATIRQTDDYSPQTTRAVIRGDYWKGFYRDMMNVSKEGGVDFKNGKKPIRLISQLIRWANNSKEAVILDFFAGSASTAHAVMEMNKRDNGRRRSISVTNNEIGKKEAVSLTKLGFQPGDARWEAEGVFHKVAMPRVKNVIGSCPSENITFFNLTYQDRDTVSRGKAFNSIAPLLWLRAGATGSLIDSNDGTGWAVNDTGNYGVLFEAQKWRVFSEAINSAGAQVGWVFIVTDSESVYQQITSELPPDINTMMLYSDYLSNFEINTGGSR